MESNKIKAILMRPGKEAQIVYVRPEKIRWIVGRNYKKYFPFQGGYMLLYRTQYEYSGKIQRANRIVKLDHKTDGDIMCGDALAVGYDLINKEFCDLTDDEIMECMIDYRVPVLKDYGFYKLKPGDELEIKNITSGRDEIYWIEKKPEKIIVAKEFKYFISCIGIWENGNQIRFSINKPFDNEHMYIRKYNGEVLR